MVEKAKKDKDRFEIAEMPVQTDLFIKDKESEEVWDDKKALLEILNKLDRIEKSVA